MAAHVRNGSLSDNQYQHKLSDMTGEAVEVT